MMNHVQKGSKQKASNPHLRIQNYETKEWSHLLISKMQTDGQMAINFTLHLTKTQKK